jgi:hypothetical protein
MTEQPRFDDSSELVPHRNFTIPFNYVWERESERWIPMEEGFGGSYLDNITFQASAFIHKFGSNPELKQQSVSISSPETIWDGSFNYIFPSDNGEALKVSSTDNSDNQEIVIIGLDENFIEKTWTGSLAGQTHVDLDGLWTRVYRMYNNDSVSLSGDAEVNNSDLSKCYAKMLDGNNQTLMALYTIPADKIGYLTRYSLSAQNTSSASTIHFTSQIRTREFGKVFRTREIVSFGTSHDTERILQFPTPLPPKTDIIFQVVSSDGNNGAVNADFDIALHDLT